LLAIKNHLFKDLGISQKYSHLEITKTQQEINKIIFDLKTVKSRQIDPSLVHIIPEKAELLPIKQFIITCNIVNQHKIDFVIDFKIDTNIIELPNFVENALCQIIIKMFKRVKQFIENIH